MELDVVDATGWVVGTVERIGLFHPSSSDPSSGTDINNRGQVAWDDQGRWVDMCSPVNNHFGCGIRYGIQEVL
jgi:hypothetical protein